MLSILEVVSEACDSIQGLAKKTQVELRVESGEDTRVWADRTRVLQILQNLLSNGIKFTPRGGRLSVGWRDREGEGDCEIWVEDTGLGIPLGEWDQVFARFGQVSTKPAHDGLPKGVGLGLALTHSLVKLQGGAIGFESEEGQGTTFRFTLPTAPPAEKPTPEVERVDRHERKSETLEIAEACVLVVEDNPEFTEMLQAFLEAQRVRVVTAETAAQGLRAAREQRPDVILADIRLPDMDGYALTTQLRSDPVTSSTPIIAVTAQAMRGDREKCLQAGCTDYVSKPVDFHLLRNLIANAIAKRDA